MPPRKRSGQSREGDAPLLSVASLGGLPDDASVPQAIGSGRWLVVRYVPTALFSLKTSMATSSVGKTLLVPTPYAIKMALVDAAFRAGLPNGTCAELLRTLARVEVRIAAPGRAVVTHTFVKIRQEPKTPNPLRPYGPSIAYREFVHHQGVWRWAFDVGDGGEHLVRVLAYLAPRVNYVGKRGSFVQYAGVERVPELTSEYTVPLPPAGPWQMPTRWHPAKLDDFGTDANLEVLSSYGEGKPKVGPHRRYVDTLIPLGEQSTGPGFTEYSAG